MKKLLSSGLILCLLLTTGCSSGSNRQKAESSETPVLTWYLNCATQADSDRVMDEINKITEPAIGAKLKLQYIDPGAYNDKMKMIMAAGTAFDLCFTGYVNTYKSAVSKGGFMGISSIIDSEAPELWNLIPDYAWKSIRINNDVYAVPNVQLYAMPVAVFLDKAMVEKYHFNYEEMKTINDLEPFLETIKENELEKYPYQPNFGVGPWLNPVLETIYTGNNEIVVRKNDKSCKVLKRYETPEYLEAIKKLNDWYNKGYIRKDVSSADGNDAISYDRVTAFASSYKPGIEGDMKKVRGKDFVAKILSTNYITTDLCLQTLTGVSATSRNAKKALALLKLINTDKDLYNLLCHGIDGVHYKKLDNNYYSSIDNSGYNINMEWALGNQFNSYIMEGKPANVWEESKKLNDTAQKSDLLGFDFKTDSVVNEISQCSAVFDEFADLEKGSVDVDSTLEAYKSKLNAAGIDRIVEDMQKQIDVFLQNK